MEADWSAEIGADLPVIDATWDGFVDLRSSPEKIDEIEEARQHPVMREVLLMLNSAGSPVFTTKCDCWRLPEAEIDLDEFAATHETVRAGFASYIDIVERDSVRFASFKLHEHWERETASSLRKINLFSGRVDVVLRSAVFCEQPGFGITLYAAGCGSSESEADAAWGRMLVAAVAATIAAASHPQHTGE
jgi:hypothetical protein